MYKCIDKLFHIHIILNYIPEMLFYKKNWRLLTNPVYQSFRIS